MLSSLTPVRTFVEVKKVIFMLTAEGAGTVIYVSILQKSLWPFYVDLENATMTCGFWGTRGSKLRITLMGKLTSYKSLNSVTH